MRLKTFECDNMSKGDEDAEKGYRETLKGDEKAIKSDGCDKRCRGARTKPRNNKRESKFTFC